MKGILKILGPALEILVYDQNQVCSWQGAYFAMGNTQEMNRQLSRRQIERNSKFRQISRILSSKPDI